MSIDLSPAALNALVQSWHDRDYHDAGEAECIAISMAAALHYVVAEIEELRKNGPQQWRPIESAPKDGTTVMVWPPTWPSVASCARFETDRYAKKPRPLWRRLDDLGRVSISRECPTTHWRPALDGPDA